MVRNFETKTWKVDDIFQDIEGDPDNVMMTIPDEIIKYLDLKADDRIQVRVNSTGLIIQKVV